MDDTEDQNRSKSSKLVSVTELDRGDNNSIKRSSLRRKRYFLITSGLLLIILFSVGALAMIYTQDQKRFSKG